MHRDVKVKPFFIFKIFRTRILDNRAISSRQKELCLCVGSKHPFDTARGSEIRLVYANIHTYGHTDTFWNHHNQSMVRLMVPFVLSI